ncbi:unnamed protein product [Lactuca virosa]|uniref:Mediator of RNA polymerase II transcription subunit 25 n=1 Tax=Lactuca virosa TaxID=75947 RepID=A0AAU9LWR2_9ASTR|nr:unnamed protein product [Lactuca virosa]
MADKKQLILVVEGTAALAPYWRTIVSDYLEKVIRSFCDSESLKPSGTIAELALIIFNAHGSFSPCLVQRSGWIRNVDCFFEWLSAIHFTGDGFGDAAIAEGLGEALMMFPPQNQHNLGVERHCILVAASNPYPLPTLVYRPPMQKTEATDNNEAQSESCFSDAETIAKAFAQCSVSLSVICPKQLPKLKAVYNAGKRNPSAADPTIDIVKNPHYLVLISETFLEALVALNRSGITNLPSQSPLKSDATSAPPGALQSTKSKYVKVWEGSLYGQRQGQPVFITRLEGYLKASAFETLAAYWPPTIHIVRIISQDHMNTKQYVGKSDFLVFRAMNQHGFLGQLQEKKLCAVIQLPSQTLLLSVSDKACRLIGMVLPGVVSNLLGITDIHSATASTTTATTDSTIC